MGDCLGILIIKKNIWNSKIKKKHEYGEWNTISIELISINKLCECQRRQSREICAVHHWNAIVVIRIGR